ncbi:MAG: diguanylate cyclase [Pseudomonadota bacterium]|nr:diguanylate cyclase [Pseudomonadota bacterium]
MEKFIIGFWGCYFGTIGLMVAGCVFGFLRGLHRVAANAALTALASAFFAVTFLGGLPIEDAGVLQRFQAHVAVATSSLLICLLFSMLGLFREPRSRRRPLCMLAGLTLVTLAAGWLMPPRQALIAGLGQAGLLGLVALGLSLRSVWRRERLARMALVGVFFMLIALAGLGSIALAHDAVPWLLHGVSALAGTVYLATMATSLWARYAYLIELRRVMAHGLDYDLVTRMRSHAQTGPMVTAAFKRYRQKTRPLGMMVISIANLQVLEQLYGLPAVNHALFVCAGRLRRAVPVQIEIGRLAGDSFLLLLPDCRNSGPLIHLAHTLRARLAKSVTLHTSFEIASLDHEHTQQTRWVADIGVGLLRVSNADARASESVARVRGVSRTAWTCPSRVAWYDEPSGEIVAMPALVL